MVGQKGVIVIAAVSAVGLCLCGVQVGRWVGSTPERLIVHLLPALILGGAAGLGFVGLVYTYLTVVRRVSGLLVEVENRDLAGVSPAFHPNPADDTDTVDAVIRRLRQVVIGHAQRAGQLTADVRDMQIQWQWLEREKKLLEGVILCLHDGIVVLDEQGRVLWVNRTACRIFGFDKADIVGCRPTAQMPSDKQAFWDEIVSQRNPCEDGYKCEVKWQGQEGTQIYHCFVSHFQTPTKAQRGRMIVLRDVTREQEVSHLKNDFVSYASHELKTPLASITAYTEMLMDNEADNEEMRHSFYAIILSQANRLHRLIEDLLNISRIESGLIKIVKSPVSLAVILEEQLQMMRSYAEERGVRLVDSHCVVHDQVFADIDMIRQVVVNLLSNAIKYNRPGGSVTTRIEVDEADHVVRMEVTDTGVGIDAASIDRIFDRFYRVGDGDHDVEGTGLGLNLVKTIVEDIHQGRVFVSSRFGKGSTFGFELPLITNRDLQTV